MRTITPKVLLAISGAAAYSATIERAAWRSSPKGADPMATKIKVLPVAVVEPSWANDGSLTVWPEWRGIALDRPRGHGISCGTNRKLVDRLVKAVEAGAVYVDVTVAEDVNGKSYPDYHCKVLGRTLNADLKRLGY
jgi:hypothetical protein